MTIAICIETLTIINAFIQLFVHIVYRLETLVQDIPKKVSYQTRA